MKNLFACLVHEKPDVVWDMVCNLHYLDPSSRVLLYDNSDDHSLLGERRFQEHPAVFLYPKPRLQRYRALHEYMIDCLRWACQEGDFDSVTNVDSDQLLLKPGYTERLSKIMACHPDFGMLQSSPVSADWPTDEAQLLIPLGFLDGANGPAVINYPIYTALMEVKAWLPFLNSFASGSGSHFNSFFHYPKWSFWPATTFSRQAAQAVLNLLDTNIYLRALIKRSQIHAAEEIIFPTLVSLLNYDLVRAPFDETCLRYRTSYSVNLLDQSIGTPDRFWIQPVPRDFDDPLRTRLRLHYQNYQKN